MSGESAHVKIEELKTDVLAIENLEVSIGRIIQETWEETVGSTPFPSTPALRDWDFKLLQRMIREKKE